MANTTSLRTQILVASADVAVYTAGQPIYTAPSGYGKKDSTVLVAPGQIVFYNPETGLSTGTAATKSTVRSLQIGVGVDANGDGASDYIRWANDGMSGCSMKNFAGKDPKCGTPNIVDALFGCIECGQTYTIEVQVYDPITLSFGEKGIGYIYHFSYTLPCGDCTTGDCVDPVPNVDEVMCGLYNKIKGVQNDPNWDITLNNLPLPVDHEYQFEVSKLYDGTDPSTDDTTFEYCLTATDGTCEDCNQYTAIGGYSLDGDEDVVFSPGTFVTVGEEGSETYYSTEAQVQSVVDQLNAALGGNGDAVLLPASGNCCSNNKIEINTCLLDFELHDAEGGVIVPCATSNPFEDQLTVYSECQDCASSNSTTSFVAGLRFFSKTVEGQCDCIPGNHALVEYFSEVEVYFKRGWNPQGVRTVKKQYATLPEGQGFHWQSREIVALRDGFTQPFVVNNWGGKWGFPEPNDLLNQVTVNCKDSYCVLGGSYYGQTQHESTGETKYAGEDIYILVPKGNSTAEASILTGLNTYFAGGDCGLPTITCADQA